MEKEYQPLLKEKEYRKAKPCNNKGFSFRANINVRVYCIHPNNQIETKEAGSKAREQERYYSIKPASSVLHDKGEVTERMRSNRGFEEAANGIRIASISDTGEARYYLIDQVDSVKVVVDSAGITLNKFEYYPYGESWITEGDGNNNPKYNSQELDRETSFYFYNARHYDPEICRFVTADTVIDGNYSASGWNRYMYVGGNPIGYKDPTGHACINKVGVCADLDMDKQTGGLSTVYNENMDKHKSGTQKKLTEKELNNVAKFILKGSRANPVSLFLLSTETSGDFPKDYYKNKMSLFKNKGVVGFAQNLGNEETVTWNSHNNKHRATNKQSWDIVRKSTTEPRYLSKKDQKNKKEIYKYNKNNDAKYKQGTNIEDLEVNAWKSKKAIVVEGEKKGSIYKVFKDDRVIGASEGQDTKYIRLEKSRNPQGTLHGHPITESQAKDYLNGK